MKFLKRHSALLIKLGALILILLFYRCPFRWIFRIDCPGCGMTRALMAALRLDFAAAFTYHPLFWLFGPIFLYFLFYDEIRNWIPVKDRLENIVLSVSSVLLLIVWVFRQFII